MDLRTCICFLVFAFIAMTANLFAAEEAPSETVVIDAEHGRQIFESICIHCHRIDSQESTVGAPGLQGVTTRRTEAWLHQWLQGPEAFAKTDVAAQKLIRSNKFGLIMPTIPEMQSEQNRNDIIAYLKTLK